MFSKKMIEGAADVMKRDGIVVFPTETFYAIGCRIDSISACREIYRAKGERESKPFPVICSGIEQVEEWFLFPSGKVKQALEKVWPAPLSALLKLRDEKLSKASPLVLQDGFSAVRISSLETACLLADYASSPIAATSANLSGKPSPMNLGQIEPEIIKIAGSVLDGGETPGGLPSTIIKFDNRLCFEVIREGAYTIDELKKYFRNR